MPHGDFQFLPRKTASDKVSRDKTFNIAKNPKYDGYQRGITAIVYKCFDEKSFGGVVTRANKSAITSEIVANQQLAEELH